MDSGIRKDERNKEIKHGSQGEASDNDTEGGWAKWEPSLRRSSQVGGGLGDSYVGQILTGMNHLWGGPPGEAMGLPNRQTRLCESNHCWWDVIKLRGYWEVNEALPHPVTLAGETQHEVLLHFSQPPPKRTFRVLLNKGLTSAEKLRQERKAAGKMVDNEDREGCWLW